MVLDISSDILMSEGSHLGSRERRGVQGADGGGRDGARERGRRRVRVGERRTLRMLVQDRPTHTLNHVVTVGGQQG